MGDMPVTAITRRDVLDLVARQTRLARSNGHYCVSVLRQVLAYGVLRGAVPFNVVTNIPVPPFNRGIQSSPTPNCAPSGRPPAACASPG